MIYLPSINQAPKELSTIAEMVKQVGLKGGHLSVTKVDLFADHAIYSKLLGVLTLTNDNIAKSNSICILAVIGKRFEDSGLSDLIVEARILGPNTIDRALRGKHYNNVVLAFKHVFVALMGAKIDCFIDSIHNTEKSHILNEFLESQIFQNVYKLQNSETFSNCIETMLLITDLMDNSDDMVSNPDEYWPNSVFWMSLLRMLQTFFKSRLKLETGRCTYKV